MVGGGGGTTPFFPRQKQVWDMVAGSFHGGVSWCVGVIVCLGPTFQIAMAECVQNTKNKVIEQPMRQIKVACSKHRWVQWLQKSAMIVHLPPTSWTHTAGCADHFLVSVDVACT